MYLGLGARWRVVSLRSGVFSWNYPTLTSFSNYIGNGDRLVSRLCPRPARRRTIRLAHFRHRLSCEQLPSTTLCLLVSILRLSFPFASQVEGYFWVQACRFAAQGLGFGGTQNRGMESPNLGSVSEYSYNCFARCCLISILVLDTTISGRKVGEQVTIASVIKIETCTHFSLSLHKHSW